MSDVRVSFNTNRKIHKGLKKNGITRMHNNEVKNTSEFNLLHTIINHPKRTKNLNSHYYPILHGCINTRKGKTKFKNFRILFNSGFSSTIVMGRLLKNYPQKNML